MAILIMSYRDTAASQARIRLQNTRFVFRQRQHEVGRSVAFESKAPCTCVILVAIRAPRGTFLL